MSILQPLPIIRQMNFAPTPMPDPLGYNPVAMAQAAAQAEAQRALQNGGLGDGNVNQVVSQTPISPVAGGGTGGIGGSVTPISPVNPGAGPGGKPPAPMTGQPHGILGAIQQYLSGHGMLPGMGGAGAGAASGAPDIMHILGMIGLG